MCLCRNPENSKNFEEENNRAFYYQSQSFSSITDFRNKNLEKGQLIQYSGENYLTRLPTCDNIVVENNEGLSVILNNALDKQEKILFMAVDFEAVVILTGIQIFFDILVPDNESIDDFKIKINEILCNIVNTYKKEHINAFPLQGYYIDCQAHLASLVGHF
ncbi:hypothetical protein C2G38_2232035 [Gigaspora rosea]|uniref:Uncharacterized protein n=1 Tax=Gigaspora rosea TaxID=44941 RepID=A0A397TUF6_9GLOM|nr:hypothetical protein C2G38_2232035 [Gigaspora rosea]